MPNNARYDNVTSGTLEQVGRSKLCNVIRSFQRLSSLRSKARLWLSAIDSLSGSPLAAVPEGAAPVHREVSRRGQPQPGPPIAVSSGEATLRWAETPTNSGVTMESWYQRQESARSLLELHEDVTGYPNVPFQSGFLIRPSV